MAAETTLYCPQAMLASGWADDVLMRLDQSGTIVGLDSGCDAQADVLLRGAVIPGMPNLHSHGFQRLMAGLTPANTNHADDFWSWRDTMYRFANRLSPEQLSDCMAWIYAEMLLGGYTSCAEFHYLHHQADGHHHNNIAELGLRVLAAADEAGLPLTLLPVLYCVSGFGQTAPLPHQRRFCNDLDSYSDLMSACQSALTDHPWHQLGIAPHSLRAVPVDTLQAMLAQWDDSKMPVHIHIAEQPAEVADCLAHHGTRPLAWLLEHAPVGPNWCLIHATHIDDGERERAAQSGAVAGLCPTTEADLGDGIFSAQAWLDAGGGFGIGSDSNLRLSVAEELRLLEMGQRLASGRRNVLRANGSGAGFMYRMAACAGARALGQPVGQLEVGKRADLVELDLNHHLLAGREQDALLESFVFAGGRDMIRSVRVAGQLRVEQGRHVQHELLQKRFGTVMQSMLKP